jgi:hypothetical protein
VPLDDDPDPADLAPPAPDDVAPLSVSDQAVMGTALAEALPPDMPPAVAAAAAVPNPGRISWMTGEFYAAIAPVVAALVAVFVHHSVSTVNVQQTLIEVGGAVSGAYAVSRTLLKAVRVHSAGRAAAAAAVAAARAPATTLPPATIDAIADAIAARIGAPPA